MDPRVAMDVQVILAIASWEDLTHHAASGLKKDTLIILPEPLTPLICDHWF